MLACTGLTEEGVECIIPTSQCLITLHLPVWLHVKPMIFHSTRKKLIRITIFFFFFFFFLPIVSFFLLLSELQIDQSS
jgi:hypothetical protein